MKTPHGTFNALSPCKVNMAKLVDIYPSLSSVFDFPQTP